MCIRDSQMTSLLARWLHSSTTLQSRRRSQLSGKAHTNLLFLSGRQHGGHPATRAEHLAWGHPWRSAWWEGCAEGQSPRDPESESADHDAVLQLSLIHISEPTRLLSIS